MTAGSRLYFAYGSNLHRARMQRRVPSAAVVGVATLRDFRLAFRKLAGDGSTKCDLEPAPGETVRGVLYRFDAAEQGNLDAAEGPGYARTTVEVAPVGGDRSIEVWTYMARAGWIGSGRPFTWYRALVAAGAGEHGFPPEYIAAVEAIAADPDPDESRAAANRPQPGVVPDPFFPEAPADA